MGKPSKFSCRCTSCEFPKAEFLHLWTLANFPAQNRGLSLLSADLLPLVPARNHGLLWVHRLHSKTPELTHWQSTTQPRERKAEVWRETKVLPPLCKGQQLSPMDCPDGHRGDQARDGLLCNQGLARREDQKFADRQAKTECWWGRWIQTPVKKRQEGQAV